MAIALNTINKDNIRLKHTSGTIVTPSSVTDIGNGNFQYKINRSWQSSDSGQWEIWTSSTQAVLDDKGNPIAAQKIGELTVDIIGLSQYIIVVPWAGLTALATLTTRVNALADNTFIESASPPDDSPLWRSWLHREEISGKIALTLYIRSLADNAAIPIWKDLEYADAAVIVPGHSNAVAISDTEFRQNLINGVSLIYAPKRDLNGQISIRLFTTTAAFSSIAANALDSGGAMTGGWVRNLSDYTGEANMVTPPAQAVKIKLTFTRSDNTFVFYEFPIS